MKILLLAGITSLSACGGATADLYLFDAPPAGVTSVRLTVASMDVHVDDTGKKDKADDAADGSIDDDKKWQSLTVGKVIDLVEHQGEDAADDLGELDLPDGKITQIRLKLDLDAPQVAT